MLSCPALSVDIYPDHPAMKVLLAFLFILYPSVSISTIEGVFEQLTYLITVLTTASMPTLLAPYTLNL